MDPSLFKTTKTQRGFTYSYFWSPPFPTLNKKPTLLFAHGFPEGSYLWRHQVPFFQRLGYGALVPEFLGYGGTDKPTDIAVYTGSGHAQDIVDILDAEGLDKVVVISHDWGVYPASRLLNYHPHRVSACAFLAVGYQPPFAPGQDLVSQYEAIKEKMGYDAFAYQRFFIQSDAAEIIEKNIDSFICLSFPPEPSFWLETECVEGVARSFVESGRITDLPAYITPEDKEHLKKALLSDGMAGRLCWYKAMAEQVIAKDDASEYIPESASYIPHPFLFVACTDDVLFLPANEDAVHAKYVTGPLTRRQLEGAGHWGAESHKEEFNGILVEWLEALEKV
ncbi:Esterase/Lipase [Favolaschia claudopus]|uniref:Esterase/Lipase n=1 Tax=Favolaschia claudopus TaxID=2862362 RepID=A0AAW0E231_9AGAR